jgi:hypothetical protein
VIRRKSVHREPTVLPSEHIARRTSVEVPLHAEPPHDTTTHHFCERGQIRLGEWAELATVFSRRPITARREHAVAHARMEVDVAVDRRAETVKEGDGGRAWPRSRRGIIST